MKLIAHRGLIDGPNTNIENSTTQIDAAILAGYDVEIDLRVVDGQLFLGHDEPQYAITHQWLEERSAASWIHCKNRSALEYCLKHDLHCFWHNIDDYTITSRGYVWAYPGKENAGERCVLVMPELHWSPQQTISRAHYGICSDYVRQFS